MREHAISVFESTRGRGTVDCLAVLTRWLWVRFPHRGIKYITSKLRLMVSCRSSIKRLMGEEKAEEVYGDRSDCLSVRFGYSVA